MSEKQQRFIMTERQNILRALCHKIAVYTDGRIILEGLIEVKDGTVGATAPRTIWEKKHADYITFAFDFTLT
jgi:hypothetical protein